MNFGDDPLADLLSDGDDSFFDEPKLSRKAKTPEKKKSVTDLFNITDSTPISRKSEDWLGLNEPKETKSPLKTPKGVIKKISFEDDDDDILGNLGLNKRPPSRGEEIVGKTTKKLDILESILGPNTKNEENEKVSTSLEEILKESKTKGSVLGTPKSATLDLSVSSDLMPREGRRGRRSSTTLMDPLGLFTEPKPKEDSEEKTVKKENEIPPKTGLSKSTPNLSEQGLPDWLGASTAPQTPIKQSQSENVLNKPSEETESTLNTILTQQKLVHSNLEYQNMGIALQQQESQILMALQLKKYEDNLGEMQLKQQEVLMKQEQQFNLLLERQFAKQQIMENNMRLQQERINNHIQMLIGQTDPKISAVEETENGPISSLKQRQNEEMFLLEESYKKQIALLEESLESVEKRLRFDIEKSSTEFEEKLLMKQQDHEEEIVRYKKKIQDLESEHFEELKQVKENHSRIIDEIKYEHSILLDNIKEAKKSESSLFQNSNQYVEKLDSNIEILYANSKSLQEIQSSVHGDYGILCKAREESLKAKEDEIILMKATLEKCREGAEKERATLLSLVRSLETKIAEQSQNSREERWAFQQAASTLAARSAAMDRESEFNRSALEREREQLKTLRESILADQEKMMLQLTEEKLALTAEKTRLATATKLTSDFETQKAKAEMEAAIQVAKEATEMTDRHRATLQREKTETEKLKRILRDKEKSLSLKEAELEDSLREADLKKNDSERAAFEAKSVEKRFNERLKELQGQLSLLSMRERKLAEEKIILARERVHLNTLMKQQKKCGLCEADPQKLDQTSYILPAINRFETVDNDIMRFRMEAEDESSLNFDENVPKS